MLYYRLSTPNVYESTAILHQDLQVSADKPSSRYSTSRSKLLLIHLTFCSSVSLHIRLWESLTSSFLSSPLSPPPYTQSQTREKQPSNAWTLCSLFCGSSKINIRLVELPLSLPRCYISTLCQLDTYVLFLHASLLPGLSRC